MKKLIACALFLTCSCKDDRPPAPTTQQSQQLNEAEGMLNDLAANEEGPADRSTGPSNSTE